MNVESLTPVTSLSKGVFVVDVTTPRFPSLLTPSPVDGILVYIPNWINGAYQDGDVYEVMMRLKSTRISDFTLMQVGIPTGGPGSYQSGAPIYLDVPLVMYDVKMRYVNNAR